MKIYRLLPIVAYLGVALATWMLMNIPNDSDVFTQRSMQAAVWCIYITCAVVIQIWYELKPVQVYRLSYRTGNDPFEGSEHSRYYQWRQEAEFHKKVLIDQSSALPDHAKYKGLSFYKDSMGNPVYTINIEGPIEFSTDMPSLYELKDIWPDNEVSDKYYPSPANVVRELLTLDDNKEPVNPENGPKVIGKINLDDLPSTDGRFKESGQYNIFHMNGEKRYKLAGYVEANSLDEAYYKSQHSDDAVIKWSIHERSTMVGDIIESPSEVCYEVLGTGFKELPQ